MHASSQRAEGARCATTGVSDESPGGRTKYLICREIRSANRTGERRRTVTPSGIASDLKSRIRSKILDLPMKERSFYTQIHRSHDSRGRIHGTLSVRASPVAAEPSTYPLLSRYRLSPLAERLPRCASLSFAGTRDAVIPHPSSKLQARTDNGRRHSAHATRHRARPGCAGM